MPNYQIQQGYSASEMNAYARKVISILGGICIIYEIRRKVRKKPFIVLDMVIK
jgi:hypothetical protein